MINIKSDSRKIVPGDIFVALKGIKSNGEDYIDMAIKKGAKTIVCEKGEYPIETIHTEDPHLFLVQYLKQQYLEKLKQMTIIGITGTNGKTTSAYLLSQMLNRLGKKSAYIGTIGFYIENKKIAPLNNTTPDLCDLYELMMQAYDNKCEYVVLEVSSQALSYKRLEGIPFHIAVFTNLTQDHLDYHKTMENYALAKQQLFLSLEPNGFGLINIDDEYKDYFLLEKNRNITYGFQKSDYEICDFKMNLHGTTFIYQHDNNKIEITSNLIGKYNIYNLLVGIIILTELGFSNTQIQNVIGNLESPSGRMEMVTYQNNLIVIDYAHTPDAMNKIIDTMREVCQKNIYVVFGCTGSRDRKKRPIMANIATTKCQKAIFTSDDLHEEEFSEITRDMTSNLKNTNYEVCMDRKKAIQKGISYLKENDVLLILGKGHEEFIIIKDKKIPFHDRTIVEQCIKKANYQK